MNKTLLEIFLQLIIIYPLIFIFLRNRKTESLKVIAVFSIFFIVYSFLLQLNLVFDGLSLFDGKWNWSGKIYSIIGSILFLVLYRKFELKDYFLTFKQKNIFLKNGILIVISILIIQVIFTTTSTLFFDSTTKWNSETILFQLTMPGIDEEIAFRGIMLGLLVKVLRSNIRVLGIKIINPAILITSILFGLVHGFYITDSFEIGFNIFPFFFTMSFGIFWGWMTLRSGSILFALISHNLGNVTNALIRMR
ncbi:MAG TPA: CPBP family intramembrane metalloprotease [Ignavibacteria bacterium]|nr:CPBP family intramembrane metalloprotease [Ignavibacteria bacterium]